MTIENYQFNYSLTSNTDKPVILLLHGFMGNIDEFDAAIELLGDDFSYLKLDLPGHGKTQVFGGDEYYSMANTAQGLINLLDKLEISKCFLVGYSMGGRLGLYLALHFPERFYQVVLESASPGLATEAERLDRVKRDAQIARKLGRSLAKTDFTAFLLNWYNQPIFGNIKNHSWFERMVESRLQNHPHELVKSLQFMGTGSQPSLWEKLQKNQIPLLLLVGEHDEKFIDINIKMTKIAPASQLKIISNAAHNVHLENTLEFVQQLKVFFTKSVPSDDQ
ncbi:Alpha/beta hydrolase fold protein [Trichormus variabilis ATCC 29413]|uniref:Putative 2-succinyl-6-hydroxy-2,4-cyclohexadiene-1-carboxylate synthase n=2 Tax=Anabaena variabilis TaxID=264691 RepID=Q3M519_TRIV2|nr:MULTISPECIES: 2-succinyl-6-hydroxy-2,4-cyclohexadiene-1-carboxylate synthase [Nostocaceae]ABA23917.1 Alpha/beta hydrolase fold protein [Trichormus variabilis ATCC 29413]MBC1215651.1 2-succinyl-6-hydroxy-2,4-cyclohexadiene-1-carboxylate synthase [Trichormus variabilis ARAD]MBC1257418.1 2-succinyl-6-hydroxy-2,4-cyclohexadiene-1-carboxylate synthase [Trichormus variabilis V5]MBC1266713.1 2-succinyl-6-hydroxy-2,4-cyclohexadiene-1-carboxylate synthase [Trichormus variabilis FSR]MBC1300492.1 2-su